jgi:hypothetical protein
LLAVPHPALEAAVRSLGSLDAKIVVDATNPITPDLSGLSVGWKDSAAEQVARLAPGARVVKAFNTVGSNVMANPLFDGRKAFLPVVGDDAAAKRTVLELANAIRR